MLPNDYNSLFDNLGSVTPSAPPKPTSSDEFQLVPRGEGPFREKYRPQKLNEIVPTCSKQQLENIISKKTISQIFLLEGITGTGKTTCARILAKSFICQDSDDRPCLKCGPCLGFETDYNITALNAADKNKVEDIRTLVEDFRYKPINGQHRVFIMDEVQRLTEAAQQVLLTELEEPPSYLLMFMCTTDSKELLKPLADRATRISFGELKASHAGAIIRQVCKHEDLKVSDDQILDLYHHSRGSIRALLNNIQAFAAGGFDPEVWTDDEAPVEVTTLYNLIVAGSWPELAKTLSKPNIRSKAESLRIGLENYFRGAILKCGHLDDAHRLGEAMLRLGGSAFAESATHQYNQLVIKCLRACNVFRTN